MAGIGIITNPHSKLNRRNPERIKLLSYVAGQKGRLEITNNLDELRKAAESFCEKDIDVLAINGGDGTISRTITAFLHVYQDKPFPKVAVLGGGTMNMVAANLNIKGSPEKNLYKLIQSHSSESGLSICELTTLKINNDYGFLFADGTSANFLEAFYKNKTGPIGAIKLVGKLVLDGIIRKKSYFDIVQEQRYTLISDQKTKITHNSCTVFASTVNKLPIGFKFFRDMPNHDFFQVVSMAMKATHVPFRIFPTAIINPSSPAHDKFSFTSKHLQINYQENCPYTLDGEIYYPKNKEVCITRGPKLSMVTYN